MSHEGNGPTAQEPQDRKALLLEQFNEVERAAAETPAETLKPEASQPQGRARDEQGKFLAKDKPATVETQAAPDVGAQPWAKAPSSWKKEKHSIWDTMSPEAREYAFQREEQMKAGVEPLLPKAELADQISRAAEPYMNTIRGLGLDLPRAVAGLMKVDHDLRTLPHEQKVALLINTARSYGVDLTGQAQMAQQAYDPSVQAIQNELLAIKGQFSDFAQQQEAAQYRAAQDEIQKFARTAEHFEEARPVMAQLLQSGMADGIDDAYDKAVRLSPDLFDKVQAAKQVAADAEKRKAADEAAKRAKAAAVSVKSATPGAAKPTNAQDRRSMLREQFDSLSERL